MVDSFYAASTPVRTRFARSQAFESLFDYLVSTNS
jgi:hypothetical protein